jgi:anti-sigma-K factor RskA
MKVIYLPDDDVVVLDVNLPDAPPNSVYQAWQISDGQPVSLGLLEANQGATAFAANLGNATAVAISVEPPGGSQAPTTTPILVSEF